MGPSFKITKAVGLPFLVPAITGTRLWVEKQRRGARQRGRKPKVVATRAYKAGYEVRTERYPANYYGSGSSVFEMKSAYTVEGAYIGSPKWAHRLFEKGIKPQLAGGNSNVCSVGYCEKDNRWYGWSHRAIVGFGVGDRVFEAGYTPKNGEVSDRVPFRMHGDVVVTSMAQAREAAGNFADYVS